MTIAPESIVFTGHGGLRLEADGAGPPGGRPVVFLHGGGQTRHSWDATARALAAGGWRTYSVDLRGHGGSEWPADGDYSLDAFAADATAVLSALDLPVVVGASLGGISALAAIGESATPLASALVLVDVAPRIEQAGADRIGEFMMQKMDEGYASLDEVADAIAAYNPHRPRPSDLNGLRHNVRQRADGRWVWHWDPRFIDRRDTDAGRQELVDSERLEAAARALAGKELPLLLIRGRVSDLLSEAGARHLLSLAPHAAYVDVEGAGHMVAGDRNDLFNDAIVSFLQDPK